MTTSGRIATIQPIMFVLLFRYVFRQIEQHP
jgi:hypothetical protein